MVEDVTLRLTNDEALVLSDWLDRHDKGGTLEGLCDHKGEVAAFRRLEGLLEKELVEPFDPRYEQLVAKARERLAETAFGTPE
jgi:hypothetical protein